MCLREYLKMYFCLTFSHSSMKNSKLCQNDRRNSYPNLSFGYTKHMITTGITMCSCFVNSHSNGSTDKTFLMELLNLQLKNNILHTLQMHLFRIL